MKNQTDWLPDGVKDNCYLSKDKEWPCLEKRIGQPRILNHAFFNEILDWVFSLQNNDFSFFEAGCGHGNDFRIMRKALQGRGRFLGVDFSKAEILRGLDFYQRRDYENRNKAIKLFAQGDLRDLKKIYIWDKEKKDFSKPFSINDNEFDLLYMEAILQGMGHGKKTYNEKKESGQKFLNEMFRISKNGGKFFGRANTFSSKLTKEQQIEIMREYNEWRFMPDEDEFISMFKQAGFSNINKSVSLHEHASVKPNRKFVLKFSFLVEALK